MSEPNKSMRFQRNTLYVAAHLLKEVDNFEGDCGSILHELRLFHCGKSDLAEVLNLAEVERRLREALQRVQTELDSLPSVPGQ